MKLVTEAPRNMDKQKPPKNLARERFPEPEAVTLCGVMEEPPPKAAWACQVADENDRLSDRRR